MLQGEIQKFQIADINNEGEGIARIGNERFVVFVPGALPGEEVTVRMLRVKKNYGIAKVLKRHNDSIHRVEPRCAVFNSCGGCQIQHMEYVRQLSMKTKTVTDALMRISGVPCPNVKDCIASPSKWGYRNKASLPVQSAEHEKFKAGFYRRRSHDIIRFDRCPVLLPKLESNVISILEDMRENNFSGCGNGLSGCESGPVRHIVFRTSKYIDESLCCVVGNRDLKHYEIKKLTSIAKKNSASINGFIYNKNISSGNFIWGDAFVPISGETVMHEMLDPYRFSFEISSFFQINSEQALNIYKLAAEYALQKSPANILELYSGIGSLTMFLASGAQKVAAVENWTPAVKYIDVNAADNGFDNIIKYSGTAEDVIRGLSDNKFEVVVLDPPRSGCAPEVIDSIIKIAPDRIVYISCNPATLARDISPLLSCGYGLLVAQPFDMFPQTGHVETVALMSRVEALR